jgi:spore photoproduct lyase
VEAAARVKDAGYYVTLRLDPMIPLDGWQEEYPSLIEAVHDIFRPDQWTLGSLRYYPGLPGWARRVGRDTSIYAFGAERSPEDGRKRIPLETRAAMYSAATEAIRRHDPDVLVHPCKETVELYRRLGLNPDGCCYTAALNGQKRAK